MRSSSARRSRPAGRPPGDHNGQTRWTTFGYAALSQLRTASDANDNTTYQYDSAGLPRLVVGAKLGFTHPYPQPLEYDKFGRRVLFLDGNGVQTNVA